jgi:hypothetical protein
LGRFSEAIIWEAMSEISEIVAKMAQVNEDWVDISSQELVISVRNSIMRASSV